MHSVLAAEVGKYLLSGTYLLQLKKLDEDFQNKIGHFLQIQLNLAPMIDKKLGLYEVYCFVWLQQFSKIVWRWHSHG